MPLRLAFSHRLLCFSIVAVVLCGSATAQENYLVSTDDGVLSLYDLTTNTPLTSIKALSAANIIDGPNNRLAFVLSGAYMSVIDTTIQREVARLTDVNGLGGALTPDGKQLIVSGPGGWVSVVDTAQLRVTRKVSVRDVQGASPYSSGAVVIAADKAYVFPYQWVFGNVAVIDLATYSVSSIALPAGQFPSTNIAAATPDGKTIVALERGETDNLYHVLIIDTGSDKIIADHPQSWELALVLAFTITPNGSDQSKIFGYLGMVGQYGLEVAAMDLRPGSPTYGQILPASELPVALEPDALAVNADGTRLVVVGDSGLPSPNTYIIDALKIVNDPNNSIIAQVTINNGVGAYAVSTGFFSTTPPNTAPVVSGVSGNITNDADHAIQITGGNFQPGALVRIGSMAPLPANVSGSSTLSVTVPGNAPAGRAIDLIVTNPGTQGPQNLQNQSGVLAGQFDILLNPKFQSGTSFVAVNLDSRSSSFYDIVQRDMVTVASPTQWTYLIRPAFDVNGKEIYYASLDDQQGLGYLFPLSTSNKNWEAPISASSNPIPNKSLVGSVDPISGKPVINFASRDTHDLVLSVIDSDPNSPTFHQTIRSWNAGLNVNGIYGYGMEVTPDGKFAFIFYRTGFPLSYYLGAMDLATGAFTYVNATELGVGGLQQQTGVQMSLSPDGKSLLLTAVLGNRSRIIVCDVSQPHQPKKLVQLTPIPIPGYGPPNIVSSRVAGNRLYAFDSRGIIVIFNFDRTLGDLRQRGWYIYPNFAYGFKSNFEFSPDGQWLYIADPLNDLIAVLDPAKLISGKDVIATTMRAPYFPYILAVSPAPPPVKALAHGAAITKRPN